MSLDNNDIAVIGIACKFPDANSGDELFENLLDNKDSIREIPKDRWNVDGLFSEKGEKGRVSSKWGGFISGVNEFDPRFFKITPSEAELMDPQQKLFLKSSWEALEDAGYATKLKTAGKQVGVYVGVTWNEFSLISNEYGYLQNDFKGPGSLYWGIPNRVSYFFDFKGPSIAIDTACSSSLVAVNLASQSLISGDCEMALAGGVNLNLHPAKYQFLSSANFLSSEGKCRSFGEGGDGYVPSEGIGTLVLKRLEDAIASEDHIYGIIKGSSTNHGGKATGYTVPNPMAHKELIKDTLKRANLKPQDISYIECHGTGTDLGDPIEFAGLRHAFEESTDKKQFCGIGSIKSNIGHCEATAGIAGLIKVLMSMQSKTLPATLHAEIPNKKIDFKNSPFYLIDQNKPWSTDNGRLIAAISSFGAGGSNCHCIVESYKENYINEVETSTKSPLVFPISSLSQERSLAYCLSLKNFLEKNPSISSKDVAYTLAGRETFEHRVVFIAETNEELVKLLESHLSSTSREAVAVSTNLQEKHAGVELLVKKATGWVEGELPIDGLCQMEGACLISLPTYAFEAKHSWPDKSTCLYQKKTNKQSSIHPLIDANVSTARGGVFKKNLFRNEYYVDEHWVQDNPVLPGVCLLEMSLFAARHYLESQQVGLFDVWFLEPVNLRDHDSVELELNITSTDSESRFDVLSNHGGVKHVTGKVRSISVDKEAENVSNLQEIKLELDKQLTPIQVYQIFGQTEIVQKGRFKVVSEFSFNESMAMAKLTLSDNFIGESQYAMNPTILDGAVQTAMIHLFQQIQVGSTILPFQIGSCINYRPLVSNVIVVARLKKLETKRYDVSIYDESGNLLTKLSDFVLKEYKEKKSAITPLVFSPLLVDIGSFSPKNDDGNDIPVCVLSGSSKITPGLRLPLLWEKMAWNVESTNEQELKDWLAVERQELPRVVLLIDEEKGLGESLGTEIYSWLNSQAARLFSLTKLLSTSNFSSELICCVIDRGGTSKALTKAILAFFRCLNLEISKSRFRVLEISNDQKETSFADILSFEVTNISREIFIRYQNNKRQTLVNKPFTPSKLPIKENEPKAWIITGGGGILGGAISSYLLENNYKVVMLGRSLQTASSKDLLKDYVKENWEYIQCNLSDKESVSEAINNAVSLFGCTWGVVHCAGIIDDAAFLNKEWSDFENVLSSKTETLLNLCDALSPHNLERLVLFSSLTSTIGNRGQTDYAFANGFIDGFNEMVGDLIPGNPVVRTMNWPYWEDGGMKIHQDKLPEYIETFITEPLPTHVGLETFQEMLSGASAQTGIIFSSSKVSELNSKTLLKPLPDRSLFSQKIMKNPELDENIDADEKEHEVKSFLYAFLENVMGLELTEDDLDIELSELGVDSIAQMDLITELEKEKRFQDLPQTLFSENTTIVSLTSFFLENHLDADYSIHSI